MAEGTKSSGKERRASAETDDTWRSSESKALSKTTYSTTEKSLSAASSTEGAYSVNYSLQGREEMKDPAKAGPSMPSGEQDKIAQRMIRNSLAPIAKNPGAHRQLYVMRHAERMDRIFPAWVRLAFTDMGKYRPYDLNMALHLPSRAGGPQNFVDDTPITEMGHVTSQMIGRAFRLNKADLTHIFCSPALRCVQTAAGVIKTLKPDGERTPKIKIEPGLFEWLSWYEKVPVWMTPKELSEKFEVDAEYKPIMPISELVKNMRETPAQHYQRAHNITKKILDTYPDAESILLVGHSTSIDACTRKLLNRDVNALTKDQMDRLGLHYPFCSVVAIEEHNNGVWKQIHNPIPPITYLHFSNRINFQYFNR